MNKRPGVGEDLPVAIHPVCIQYEHDWRETQDFDAVLGELVVKSWRQSDQEGNCYSFSDVDSEEVQSTDWKQKRHSWSIEHGDKHDVQQLRILCVHFVFSTKINGLVCCHGCLLGDMNVVSPFTVDLLFHSRDCEASDERDKWFDSVDYHRLDNIGANIAIPCWHIIIKVP